MAFFAGGPTASSVANTPKGKIKAKGTSQQLLAENKDRIGVYVSNPSTNEVWLALGGAAVAEEGIWLKKEQGAVFIQGYAGPISCITTSGEGNISFSEI